MAMLAQGTPGWGCQCPWGEWPVTLPFHPTDASAALQVRAVKDYCNNYDLTSLNVKAGDVITVSVAGGAGDTPVLVPAPGPAPDPAPPTGAGAARGRALEGLHPRQPHRQRPRGLLPLQPRRGHKQTNRQIIPPYTPSPRNPVLVWWGPGCWGVQQ